MNFYGEVSLYLRRPQQQIFVVFTRNLTIVVQYSTFKDPAESFIGYGPSEVSTKQRSKAKRKVRIESAVA